MAQSALRANTHALVRPAWRNWYTRRFQKPVPRVGGSSPPAGRGTVVVIGCSSMVERSAHNGEVTGSNPVSRSSLGSTYVLSFDASSRWQLLFQDPASPVMEGIIEFHHDVMFVLVFIVFFVLYMLCSAVLGFADTAPSKKLEAFSHNTALEVAWTLIPSFVLLLVAVPSFALLYSIDELVNPAVTLKSVGHQWYWTYEYSDYGVEYGTLGVESYMVADEDLPFGTYRLLETNYRVVLPTNVHVRALVTSADVLHSWAIPSLGVKVDACPGRLNQAAMFIKREGVYYGQCSEICGVNHGFMPIVVQGVSLDAYYG